MPQSMSFKDINVGFKKIEEKILENKKRVKIKFPKKNSDRVLLFILVLLLGFLVGLIFFNDFIKIRIILNRINQTSFSSISPKPYPVLNNLNYQPEISAEAVLIMDPESNIIIYSKNEKLLFSMASTTKIMTALTGLESFKLDDVLTIKEIDKEGTPLGFKKGDKLTFESLLYAMLLPSSNDAALAIAQNYPSGEKAFIARMNENAKKNQLITMHFSDSVGLNDDEDYTTSFDLAKLASIALENKIFANIVSTKQKQITNINGSKKYVFANLNKLLGENGVNGVKTGYTDEAGGVLVTSRVDDNGRKFIFVVMKSEDRFTDTSKLLSFISGNISYLDFSR